MRKSIILTAALAMLAALPMGGVQIAQAATVAGSETCGELPNVKWTWVITTAVVRTGGGTTTATDTANTFSSAGNNGIPNNGWEVTSTTTTTAPTYDQTNSICTAVNPAGKVNLDHSTTVEGTPVLVDAGGSSTEIDSEVKICDNNNTNNNSGNALPACPAL
jgi:hypothetical protein